MRNFLLLFLLCLLSLQTSFSQSFKTVGYLPYYRFNYLNDIEFQRVTHVNIAFANPDAQGNLSVSGTNIDPAIAKAHQAGCQVFISLAGGYLDTDTEAAWTDNTLPATRAAFIQKIVQYVQNHQLDGVDVDLEWQYVKSWYSPFIVDLKAALTTIGKPLSVALPGNYRYPQITNAALDAFDWINMMVYDLRGPWDPSNPGQHSPYDWAVDCIAYWKNQNIPANRLTLGVPFYGYDFGVSPVVSFNYRGIVNQDPANAYLDHVDQKWWNGIPTIKAKTQLALDEVSGIMIWELGQDAFGSNIQYSLLRAIDEVISSSVGIAEHEPNALRVYPNPVSDWLHFQLPEDQSFNAKICDMNGRVVLETVINEQANAQVDVSRLPSGMYTLLVSDGNGKRYSSLIVHL